MNIPEPSEATLLAMLKAWYRSPDDPNEEALLTALQSWMRSSDDDRLRAPRAAYIVAASAALGAHEREVSEPPVRPRTAQPEDFRHEPGEVWGAPHTAERHFGDWVVGEGVRGDQLAIAEKAWNAALRGQEVNAKSRAMFVARLENHRPEQFTGNAVLALLSDCDMLAKQGPGTPADPKTAAVAEEMFSLLASVSDNLGDMPVSDAWAAKTSARADALLSKLCVNIITAEWQHAQRHAAHLLVVDEQRIYEIAEGLGAWGESSFEFLLTFARAVIAADRTAAVSLTTDRIEELSQKTEQGRRRDDAWVKRFGHAVAVEATRGADAMLRRWLAFNTEASDIKPGTIENDKKFAEFCAEISERQAKLIADTRAALGEPPSSTSTTQHIVSVPFAEAGLFSPSEAMPPAAAPPANTAAVSIDSVHRGAYFSWSQTGCGFGQLSFEVHEDGKIHVMNEMMGREWIRKALYALADHVANTGVLDIEPRTPSAK